MREEGGRGGSFAVPPHWRRADASAGDAGATREASAGRSIHPRGHRRGAPWWDRRSCVQCAMAEGVDARSACVGWCVDGVSLRQGRTRRSCDGWARWPRTRAAAPAI
eukprot:2716510-Prymnesium_polylepis.2